MKVVELREKNIEELYVLLDDLKKQIHQNRMDFMLNKSQDSNSISSAKKDLARIKTIIKEKEKETV